MLRNLAELLNSSWNPKELTKDSLKVNAYDPIASAFLGKIERSARYYGNDKELESSKWCKLQQQALNVAGRKPDRSADVKAADGTVFNVYVKVKTATQSKHRPDLVKLAIMLKDNCDFDLSHDKDCHLYFSVGMLQ